MSVDTPENGKQTIAIGVMVFAVAAALAAGSLSPRDAERGGAPMAATGAATAPATWLQAIETGDDHIAPRELARELLAAPRDLALVDVRPADEFARYHLPFAVNLTVPEVCGEAGARLFAQQPRLVVLYSNGPTHPGQAWVELRQQGHTNVKVLAGGLDDFKAQILLPPSLREGAAEAASKAEAPAYALRRAFFLGLASSNPLATWATDPVELTAPTMVSPQWLQARLGKLAVVDLRARPEDYAGLHIPGAVHLSLAKIRQKRGDRDLFFVPDADIAAHFGSLGIAATTPVVLYTDEKLQDPTLAALALLRLGHRSLAILEGGIVRWATEHRPLVDTPSTPVATTYTPRAGADDFTIGIDELAPLVEAKAIALLDVRPAEFFTGAKSTEARPGHIPGAKNRLFSNDLKRTDDGLWVRPRAELEPEYAALGLTKDEPVVVSCRTGHTASEAFFVMRYLLGYEKVRWFNGSWTEWADHKDLPAALGER